MLASSSAQSVECVGERRSRASLFDTIADETSISIVRWASSLNNGHPPELMFDPHGPLFPVIRRAYKKLNIYEPRFWPSTDPPANDELLMTSKFALRSNVIKCLGPTLSDIQVDLNDDGADLVRDILRFCKELRSLKIDCYGGDSSILVRQLVTCFAYCQKELHISSLPDDLRLSGYSFPQLKSLILHDARNLDTAIDIVRNTGECLEKIVVESSATESKWKELFEFVRPKCALLSSICMGNDDREEFPREEYQQFLVSYGPQLRFASFYDDGMLHEEDFQLMGKVVPYCPNVEFIVWLDDDSEDVDACVSVLNSIAPHIKEIDLQVDSDWTNWEAFERFANRLDKLKHIKCSYASIQAFLALFAVPKPSLEILNLERLLLPLNECVVGKMKNSMSNVRVLNLRISQLEMVQLYCRLLEASSNLRRIGLYVDFHSFETKFEDYCNRLLRAMRGSYKLEYIRIGLDGSECPKEMQVEIRNKITAAQLFRFRHVHVEIFGVVLSTRVM